jgi:pimeloyl-ACP methyl ester carboxylesterase
MPSITIGKEHTRTVELAYEDHGRGKPVILIHGWPLSGKSWEKQVAVLVEAGHRVITYDRRGFGDSSRPIDGYDYETLTDDLRRLVLTLGLQDLAIVGFSMGGGEVARYCGQYGTEHVRAAVFVSSVTPFLLKTADNPDGIDPSRFAGMCEAIGADRPAFLETFLHDFFNADVLGATRISERAIEFHWNDAVRASPVATSQLCTAWSATDFRADLARIDVPTLIIHGEADRTVPPAISARLTHAAVSGSSLLMIPGAPHGLNWTHALELNRALLDFLH